MTRWEQVVQLHSVFTYSDGMQSGKGIDTRARISVGGYLNLSQRLVSTKNLDSITIFPEDLDSLAEAVSIARKARRRAARRYRERKAKEIPQP